MSVKFKNYKTKYVKEYTKFDKIYNKYKKTEWIHEYIDTGTEESKSREKRFKLSEQNGQDGNPRTRCLFRSKEHKDCSVSLHAEQTYKECRGTFCISVE